MKLKHILPLLLLLVLAGFLAYGLTLDPRNLPSTLVGRQVPDFQLPRLDDPQKTVSPRDMAGRPWLLNVWASWCTGCRQEHAMLVDIAGRNLLPIVGLNYKEVRGAGIDVRNMSPESEQRMAIERADQWLTTHGDPYVLTALDLDGRVGIDFGVYGVPETFLIDANGKIRYKYLGPINAQSLETELLPRIREVMR